MGANGWTTSVTCRRRLTTLCMLHLRTCPPPPPDGGQWLDELMEDLSDLSSSSDDSLYDLWEQFMEDVLDSFDLDDFVS